MPELDDDDDARPTTALNAAEMRAMIGKASTLQVESSVSVVNELPSSPRATDAIAPIVIIVDKPATVIGGLIKSARSAGQRLVTLSKFRALRNEAPAAPADPLRQQRVATARRPQSGAPPLPDSAFAPPPDAVAVAAEPEPRVRTHSEMTRPVVLEPHEGPALEVEAPVAQPAARSFPQGTRPLKLTNLAGGVAVAKKPLLDGYALAALMFIAAAVVWMVRYR